ncbi:MAG: hypothetical protein ACRDKT_05380, partial [Actinomycetota bacterium]
MSTLGLAEEIILDLLRSAWVVEAGRTKLYEKWGALEDRYVAGAERTTRRGEILAGALAAQGKAPDEGLVEDHHRWLESLVGGRPDEVPLGFLFAARIGDWIDTHVATFLPAGGDELKALGDEERSGLEFPNDLPPAPGYEPVVPTPVEPPGDVRFRFA